MKSKKGNLILVAVIAALALYLVFKKTNRTNYDLPKLVPIEAKSIDRVVIKNKDATVELKKSGTAWKILPQGYPAETGPVDSIVKELAGLTVTALASESGSDAVYELDRASRIEASSYNGNKLLRSFQIGKNAGSGGHTFVKVEKLKGVFLAEGNLRPTFDTNVAKLRDKSVMKIEDDVSSISLTQAAKTLSVQRIPAPPAPTASGAKQPSPPPPAAQKWKSADGKPVVDSEIDEILSALTHLSCEEFIEGKQPKEFASPAYRIALTGKKKYELSFYTDKDGSFAAVSSESAYPFRLSPSLAKRIMKDIDKVEGSKK